MWKTVIYNNQELLGYEINELGEVRSSIGSCNPWQMYSHGEKAYLVFSAGRKINPLIHKAVAETFIPNPNNLPIVNHIDGNKLNNRVENLEWVTFSENLQHAYDNNLRKSNKIPPPTKERFIEAINSSKTMQEAADFFNVSSRTIARWFKEFNFNNWTSFKKGEF